MNSVTNPPSDIPSLAAIVDSLERAARSARITPEDIEPGLDVLSECLEILNAIEPTVPEPLRIIHHLSCVGGTVVTKCIASMANVLILNELDFHSPLTAIAQGKPTFTPTDIVSLLKQGDANIGDELLTQLLVENLATVIANQQLIGRSVVLREHSHGHFLVGPSAHPDKGTLSLIADKVQTLSLVTVRDPAESFLSMKKAGWHTHFTPSEFHEYAGRYHAFLDAHEGAPIVKYEDFVEAPQKTMKQICDHLNLAYYDAFLEVFNSFEFSGDSGRGGKVLQRFSKREEADQFRQHTSYRDLADRLGYDDAS